MLLGIKLVYINNMNDINAFKTFTDIQNVIDRIKRVSFYANQTQQRYPLPESMTREELTALTRVYLALYLDIEQIQKDFKKLYDKHKGSERTTTQS